MNRRAYGVWVDQLPAFGCPLPLKQLQGVAGGAPERPADRLTFLPCFDQPSEPWAKIESYHFIFSLAKNARAARKTL